MNARIPLACVATAVVALGLCHEARAVDPNRRLSEYAHNVWKTGDDGLYGQADAIAQSGDGYLWVGTTAGLFRFDGIRFRLWGQSMPGHPFDGLVTDLFSSTDGNLWVGTENKGLSLLKGQRVDTTGHYFVANGIIEDEAGVIWYTTFDPNRYQLCSLGHDAVPHCRLLRYLCSSLASLRGIIWCGADTGLLRFDHGKQLFIPIAGMASATGQAGDIALIPDDRGGLYVGIERSGPGLGLEQLRGNRLTPVTIGNLDGSRLSVSTLFKDREGALWIDASNDGIYRIYKGLVDHLPTPGRDDPIVAFAEDREGSIWAATLHGIERFSDRAVVSIHDAQGVAFTVVTDVTVTPEGTLWVGGFDTLLTLRPGSRTFTAPARLPANSQVTSILEDHSGTMWIGIDDSLYTLAAHKLTPVMSATGKPLGMILSLAEDSAFNVWAVTHGSTRQILRIDEHSRRISQVTTLPPASRIAADPDGGVYIAALNGDLVHVDSHGQERSYTHLVDRSARISHLVVTNEGVVYASTPFGLETLNNGHIGIVDTRNGLPCNRVYDTAVDHSGDLWLSMQCALVRIPRDQMLRWRKTPSAALVTQVFDAEDGVETRDADFNGSAITPDGTLWFANGELQKIDPRSTRFGNGLAPPVHIEQLAADGKDYSVYGLIDLPPLSRDIQIDYAGLSLIAPDKVHFRYKLEGFDENWKDVGARRQAFYTALPPGSYRFRVIASNKDGVWNTVGDSLNFYLAPALYQTLWFRLLCGLLAALLLWLIFQLRLRQVVAQVRARQSARYAERERIARALHDTLLQSVQGLIWRFSATVEKMRDDVAERRALKELLDRSDEILAEARDSILDLREPGNRSLALAEEISALGNEAASNSGMPVTVLTNGTPYKLNPDTYENTILIVREALLNAVRHAKARSVEVQIDYLEHELRISVRDDGQGIDQDTLQHGHAGHWGMLGMRERSKSFHAKLRILSRPGAGTEIELVVPRAHGLK